MSETARLINALADFRHRRRVMDLLLFEGEAAVSPLIEALASPLEGVRWAAVKLLGQLGDRRALEPLRALESDPTLGGEAREAIQHLAANGLVMRSAEETEGLSAEELATVVASGSAITVRGGGDNWVFRVELPDGRGQTVRFELAAGRPTSDRLAFVYTFCGPAAPEHFEKALRFNMRLPVGALAMVDVDGQPELVLVETLCCEALSVEGLRRVVLELARRGDALEGTLAGEDRR